MLKVVLASEYWLLERWCEVPFWVCLKVEERWSLPPWDLVLVKPF